MKEKEQISEEFARDKLLNNTYIFAYTDRDINNAIQKTLNSWKEKGYIKKSKEEEIKERLNDLYEKDIYPYKDLDKYIIVMTNIKNLQKELIEILESKIKDV